MKILICGVGAIGSNLASLLVPDLQGEHQITILDNDEVEERNVRAGTQFYTRDQIGLPKVEALQYNLYKWYEREVEIINKEIMDSDDAAIIIDPETLVRDPRYGNQIATSDPYDLVLDCFDNHDARESISIACSRKNIPCLHAGFSDQFTFAIEWNDNYQVPSDIISGMDICEMEGAASFVKMVSAISSLTVQDFIRNNKKVDYVGNRLTVTKVN